MDDNVCFSFSHISVAVCTLNRQSQAWVHMVTEGFVGWDSLFGISVLDLLQH